MTQLSAIFSLPVLGNRVGLFIHKMLAPGTIVIDLSGEDYQQYL